ncbi:hypothetical protein SK128_008810 [Halocaridina rubra]|uniref:Uncharacterized protein n=1 Tax=Halocaridina rubra TaxID=373956 RepID=A0AAN8X9Y1_HALRR
MSTPVILTSPEDATRMTEKKTQLHNQLQKLLPNNSGVVSSTGHFVIQESRFHNTQNATPYLNDHLSVPYPGDQFPEKKPLISSRNFLRMSTNQDTQNRSSDVEDPPPGEVAAMLSDVMSDHLPGCYKTGVLMLLWAYPQAILHSFGTVHEEIAQSLARILKEAIMTWNLDAFLLSPPPPLAIFTQSHAKTLDTYCVAVVIIANVKVKRQDGLMDTLNYFIFPKIK